MRERDQFVVAALQCGADGGVLQRVLDRLPAMSIGYEPVIRQDLLRALASFADLTPKLRLRVPACLATLGWNSEDIQEAVEAIDRVHTDPRTPEEWVVHDAYVVEHGGRSSCITPWGVHLQTHPTASPPRPSPTAVGDRLAMVDAILGHLAGVRPDHPVRVAVDGGTAAGKTTLAQELAERHAKHGGAAIRASFDFFKIPPEQRARHGFGGQVFDEDALIEELLQPLGPGGSRRYRIATYDSWTRRSLRERPARIAPEHAVAFVDGAFLTAHELQAWWDFWIFIEVDSAVATERYVVRDALWEDDPDPERMRSKFAERYLPAESAYAQAADPWRNADVLVRNDVPERPRYSLLGPGR